MPQTTEAFDVVYRQLTATTTNWMEAGPGGHSRAATIVQRGQLKPRHTDASHKSLPRPATSLPYNRGARPLHTERPSTNIFVESRFRWPVDNTVTCSFLSNLKLWPMPFVSLSRPCDLHAHLSVDVQQQRRPRILMFRHCDGASSQAASRPAVASPSTHRAPGRTRHRLGRQPGRAASQPALPRRGQERLLAADAHRRAQPAPATRTRPHPPRR